MIENVRRHDFHKTEFDLNYRRCTSKLTEKSTIQNSALYTQDNDEKTIIGKIQRKQ